MLVHLLLIFVSRRVMGVGALRLRSVRWGLSACALVVLIALTAAAHDFLEPFVDEKRVWNLLFSTLSVSLLLWVAVAFLFVKVLFLQADGLLELTCHLPLTGRERALALVVFEASVTLALAAITVGPVTLSAVMLRGPAILPTLLVSILLPATTAYVVLAAAHAGVVRLAQALHAGAVAQLLAVVMLFLLISAYASQMTDLVGRSVAGGSDFFWPTAIGWLADRGGIGLTTGAVLILCLGLAVLVVATVPRRYVAPAAYLGLRLPRVLVPVFRPEDLAFARSQHTFVGAVVGAGLFVYLVAETTISPLWSLCTLTVGGLYQFSSTMPLRLLPGPPVPAWRTCWRLLRSVLILVLLVAIPTTVTAFALGRWDGWWVALLGAAASATLAICIGIVFPAEKANPLAALAGLGSLALILTLVTLGVSSLGVPLPVGLLGAIVVLTIYAIQSVHIDRRRQRNEDNDARHQRTGRGGSPDPGLRRPGDAVPDVLSR